MRKSETGTAALDKVVVWLSQKVSPHFNRPTIERLVRENASLFEEADVVVT